MFDPLSAALVAGVLSASVAIWATARNVHLKAVAEQRQEWREAVRDLVSRLLSEKKRSEREKLCDSIVLRLNPSKDRETIELIAKFVSEPSGQHRSLVRSRIQRMLKHDWERAKIEAKVFPYFADARAAAELKRQDRRYSGGKAMMPR